MFVKSLQGKEILDALHLVWEVFAEEIAPTYTPQGVAEFQQFIKFENFMPRVTGGEMAVFGAVEGNELCGVSAVQNNGHVALLFVRKKWQRHGAAKMLMSIMERYCVNGFSIIRMTVNAAPNSVEAYRHMGFSATMPEQVKNGIRYVPMERMTAPGDIPPQNMNRSHKGLFIGIGVSAAVLLILLVFLLVKVAATVRENAFGENEEEWYEEMPFDEDEGFYGGDESEEGETEEELGIEAIRCYEAENLPYTIKEETYTYRSDGQNGEYPIEFDVKYPQIEGLEGEKADKVNEILEQCAMNTVDMLYLNPSEEMKEFMLQESNPLLASQVIYRVTYAGEDFVSVTFSDHYFAGSYYAEFQDLRTKNIRLSDGKEYTTADIVELSDKFMDDWYQRMVDEAPEADVLYGLKTEEFHRILEGEALENRYAENFFVSADGIEIGFTYHYLSKDQSVLQRGWVTAPFAMDEIKGYKTDSDFWNLV